MARHDGLRAFRPRPRELLAQADREPELRALARCARHADLAAHHLGQLFRDGQAQAGAAVLASGRGVHLAELREEQADLFLRDADARVAHREAQQDIAFTFFHQCDADRHLAGMGELDGVARQIGENLAQAARVAAERRGDRGLGAAE